MHFQQMAQTPEHVDRRLVIYTMVNIVYILYFKVEPPK